MCVVVAKKFKDIGWCLGKARDRNYETTVRLVQSNRLGIQRLYIDDVVSRWTEGLNEHGLCILSAAFSVKDDEKEAGKKAERGDGYMSPDGKKVRTALLEKTPKDAIKVLLDLELDGATIVANQDECWLIEAAHENRERKKFFSKVIKLKDDEFAVRTNHGILLPKAGYQKGDDPKVNNSRKSSESRYDAVKAVADEVETPFGLLRALSNCPNKDTFMNPIRTGDPKKGDMVTTAQILLVPKERTLYYRPIYSGIEIKAFHKLNGVESKTFFEVVSSRKLLNQSFRDKVKGAGEK